MSIKKSFNGKTIRKPGAYSKDTVDNSAGAELGATDVVFIVGESSMGAPGSAEGIQSFSSDNLSALVAKYGDGPLVDQAQAAVHPAKSGQNINGASTILVWKTNQSTQASKMIKQGASNMYQVLDSAWGLPGNGLSLIVANGDSGNQKALSVSQLGGTTENLGENAANPVLTIHYSGNGTAASAAISGLTNVGKILATSLTGQSDSSVNLSIQLKNYTMKTLVDYINAQPGYVASLSSTFLASTPAYELDPIAASDIKGASPVLRMLQYEILDVINSSARISGVIQDPPIVGLPDNGTFMLAGGAQGASANSDFSTGLANSLGEDYNSASVAISRDASEDVADQAQGFTDPSSTYDVESVIVALDQHLQLRGDTQNRKEAQGFAGVRKSSKAAAFAFISNIGDSLMQVCMQDVLFLDSAGSLRWGHPHILAALAMGIRAGQDVGEPLTHKFPNVLGVGHMVNPVTGVSAGDFNPGTDYNAAIDAGVLFLEKAAGGQRFVVDNTTYGVDDSFVYNRGSVIAAKQYVDRTLRQTAEDLFVGKKVSNGLAKSIKSAVRNKLRELNQPDVNIITSSADAPEGFREDTFVVTVNGNTATVQVEYKPVQGLDFVFFNFTLGDIKQTA